MSLPVSLPVGVITEDTPVWDWEIAAGVLTQLNIPVLDSAGELFTVNGWSVDAKVKTRPGGSVLHTWQPADIAVAGTSVTLTVLPATSLAWRFTASHYRVKIIHPSDATQIYRILQGRFDVLPD